MLVTLYSSIGGLCAIPYFLVRAVFVIFLLGDHNFDVNCALEGRLGFSKSTNARIGIFGHLMISQFCAKNKLGVFQSYRLHV